MTMTLNLNEELKTENYYVESVSGWDTKLLHFYLTYLKTFLLQLKEQRYNPLEYSTKSAQKELKNINLAISAFGYLIVKYETVKDQSDELEKIYHLFKNIYKELKNNKIYLENLSNPDKNLALKESIRKMKLSNFLSA